jgi:hypothetical protein
VIKTKNFKIKFKFRLKLIQGLRRGFISTVNLSFFRLSGTFVLYKS